MLVTCIRLSPSNPQLALKVYELARKSRAETFQASGAETRDMIHLSDGPEQEGRDARYRAMKGGGDKPDRLVDRSFQDFMYGFDVVKDVEERWDELVAKVVAAGEDKESFKV